MHWLLYLVGGAGVAGSAYVFWAGTPVVAGSLIASSVLLIGLGYLISIATKIEANTRDTADYLDRILRPPPPGRGPPPGSRGN